VKTRQRVENVQDIFCILSFSSSNSYSPGTLAHKRWGVREYFHHRLTPLSSGCILLYSRVCRKLIRVIVVFWTPWLVALNMTPFAITFPIGFRQLNDARNIMSMHKNSCSCFSARTSVSWIFALHCGSGCLQTCCFSLFAFRLFLCLNQKPPFAPWEVSRCRLLSLLQSSGSASFTCFVSLLSVLLHLSCTLTRRHFVSLEHFLPGSAASYFTPLLPDSELIRTLFVLHRYVYLEYPAVCIGPVICPISWVIHSVAGVICAGHNCRHTTLSLPAQTSPPSVPTSPPTISFLVSLFIAT